MAARKQPKAKPAPSFGANDQIIADPERGLEWSPTLGDAVNWKRAGEIAKAYRGGGHTDWRLPTPAELVTLVDYDRAHPAANTDLFPDMKPDAYWTNKPLKSSPRVYAWYVNFDNGGVGCNDQSNRAFVRAVRGSRASQ
jgi:hypothetical protein